MSGYVMVPRWLRTKKPSANAILIYITLASYGTFNTDAGTYEECRPALATVAEDSGLSESTVKRALSELLELGAVIRRQRFAEDGRTSLPSVYRVVFGDLSEPPGSTGERGGGSTGGPPGGSPVTRNQEPHTQNHNTKKPSATPRGTRLPKGWEPSEELKNWAAERLPAGWQSWAAVELEKFRNYWAAKTGSSATKLDWSATFRNWMLTAAERHGTAPGRAPVQQFKTAAEKHAERKERERERTQLADQLYQTTTASMAEAYEQAGEMIAAKAVTTCTPVGYIDGEVTEIDSPAQKEVTPR